MWSGEFGAILPAGVRVVVGRRRDQPVDPAQIELGEQPERGLRGDKLNCGRHLAQPVGPPRLGGVLDSHIRPHILRPRQRVGHGEPF